MLHVKIMAHFVGENGRTGRRTESDLVDSTTVAGVANASKPGHSYVATVKILATQKMRQTTEWQRRVVQPQSECCQEIARIGSDKTAVIGQALEVVQPHLDIGLSRIEAVDYVEDSYGRALRVAGVTALELGVQHQADAAVVLVAAGSLVI